MSKLQIVILVVGGIMAVHTGLEIWRIWKSNDRLTQAQVDLKVAQSQQSSLQKQLTYVQSDEFAEKEAREKLGYGRPGEVIVILPKEADTSPQVLGTKEDLPPWKQWWNLYIGI